MATWQLITGVTGLLGQHLLIDHLRRRIPTVVIARSKPGITAYERIDQMVSACECRLRQSLERPLVLEGELTAPALGLSANDYDWCRRNVRTVLHCAASVKFEATKTGEPIKTNVDGTKRILEVFAESALRDFHYVSSAYVCGKRDDGDVVAERLHPLSTMFRNIYEDSKCQAERLVMSAPGEFERSIYRPSIIVGHLSDGYSPSFNALYKPMQLVWLLVKEFPFALRYSKEWLNQFGIGANDSRNVVPVDWVSAAITNLMHREDSRGRVFHITNPNPVKNRDIVAAIAEVLSRHFQDAGTEVVENTTFLESLDGLNDQLDVYRAYFSVDPVFDTTNVSQSGTCPPCPKIGLEELVRIFSYAVDAEFKNEDFRSGKKASHQALDLFRRIAAETQVCRCADATFHEADSLELQADSNTNETTPVVRVIISGPGGGCWQISLINGRAFCHRPEETDESLPLLYSSAITFEKWLRGTMEFEEAIRSGAFVLVGTGQQVDSVHRCLLAIRSLVTQLAEANGKAGFNKSEEPRVELVSGSVRHGV